MEPRRDMIALALTYVTTTRWSYVVIIFVRTRETIKPGRKNANGPGLREREKEREREREKERESCSGHVKSVHPET